MRKNWMRILFRLGYWVVWLVVMVFLVGLLARIIVEAFRGGWGLL